MAYLVKPVMGETQRMELVHIHEALKNGLIAENWLVRDERQDFWYSVGKLIGKSASNPITVFCPKCSGPIRAKYIDIGLPASCAQCGTQITIPDPEAAKQRVRDEQRLKEWGQKALWSGIALAVGTIVTVGSFLYPDKHGTRVFWWGPIAFGLGTFIVCFPQYLQLRRKLKK